MNRLQSPNNKEVLVIGKPPVPKLTGAMFLDYCDGCTLPTSLTEIGTLMILDECNPGQQRVIKEHFRKLGLTSIMVGSRTNLSDYLERAAVHSRLQTLPPEQLTIKEVVADVLTDEPDLAEDPKAVWNAMRQKFDGFQTIRQGEVEAEVEKYLARKARVARFRKKKPEEVSVTTPTIETAP
jgi:hypothetical protein